MRAMLTLEVLLPPLLVMVRIKQGLSEAKAVIKICTLSWQAEFLTTYFFHGKVR